MKVAPERKVYVPLSKNDRAKMHLKHDCSCLQKNGVHVEKKYLTQQEARAHYGAVEFCMRCSKPKSRKGVVL